MVYALRLEERALIANPTVTSINYIATKRDYKKTDWPIRPKVHYPTPHQFRTVHIYMNNTY